jgi:phosphomannomutase
MQNTHEKLESVRQWLAQKTFDRNQMGPMFVDLLRVLTEAESPEVWDPAIATTHRFLDRVSEKMEQDPEWPYGESAKLFSIFLTLLAEAGQYRYETKTGETERGRLLQEELLPQMAELREQTIEVAKQFLRRPIFDSLKEAIREEIFPLLESMSRTSGENSQLARDRYMPFRVVQVGNIYERLRRLRLRTSDPRLVGDGRTPGLLDRIYELKYLRFGTSGVRGRWEVDFTKESAQRVVQAICDFLKDEKVPDYVGAEDLRGRRIVIGYDTRANAKRVAEWVAQVCLANGFQVDFAYRPTPTPALVYYLTDYLDEDDVAGLINCTASHNPPEWQGIKFNPREGYPAPTSLTNFIASRANEIQLLDEEAPVASLERAESQGDMRGFDPIVHYTDWLFASGHGNERIAIDPERIRKHFQGKMVIIDEMYGAARGYLPRALGEIGVRFKVIHAERDPRIPGLPYANPEEPFINDLKQAVEETEDAVLGIGMDTDADRFGIVDHDGTYYRPNQVLPMLVRYLGIDRQLNGRVVVTQTGSPLNDPLAGKIPNNEAYEPAENVIPAFVDHPFYYRRVGEREDRVFEHVFMVPVGIKYIEEQRRTNRRYEFHKELPEGWRNTLLIGGEESSGLTTRGHVTDKDGVWANLLIMDMIAYYGKSFEEIWEETVEEAGWKSYGGYEIGEEFSNRGREDVDAVLEAKEALINRFLDRFKGQEEGEAEYAGLDVIYAGGIRYDFVGMQFRDDEGGTQHYLRVRASGTEPINRIYVESSSPHIARRLMDAALEDLRELSAEEIRKAHSEWRLADILSATRISEATIEATRQTLEEHEGWSTQSLTRKLQEMLAIVENRDRKTINEWIEVLQA